MQSGNSNYLHSEPTRLESLLKKEIFHDIFLSLQDNSGIKPSNRPWSLLSIFLQYHIAYIFPFQISSHTKIVVDIVS
jgi:hypothetical protein